MADSTNVGTGSSPKPNAAPGSAAASQAPKGNPVFRMMGMPNFRFKLPSRNWMIFWTIIGSWTGAWYYDRHEKKKIQRKWATLVQHLASEPIPMNALPRKLTVYLTTPPADSVMTAREHFHEYIRPILAASGVDWDAVEGRKEGDVRAQLAERIRKLRKRRGELTETPVEETDAEVLLDNERARMGVFKSPEVEGDIVIGRNTWKEYVRGLHEGWLGPLDPPKSQEELPSQENENGNGIEKEKPPRDRPHDIGSIPTYAAEKIIERATPKHKDQQHDDEPPTSPPPSDQPEAESSTSPSPDEKKADEKKEEDTSTSKKRKQPPPFISTSDYPSAPLSPNIPSEFAPSTTIPLPHLLGFRNTPIRMYRFLTRRYLADDVGRQVAAAVLAAYRPYHQYDSSSASSPFPEDSASPTSFAADEDAAGVHFSAQQTWEQQQLLENEEPEWHKSLRKERDPEKESVWLDGMVIDPRIGGRMRRFELATEEEERAKRIRDGKKGPKEKVSGEDLA